MGRYVPRIVSPITGEEEAAPVQRALQLPADEANMSRWSVWWKRANLEQFVSFALIGGIAIIVSRSSPTRPCTSNPALPDSSGFDFIALEGQVLDEKVGTWFGTLFLAVGAISLFAAALGIVDYVGRLLADIIYMGYTRDRSGWSESQIYFAIVWAMVVFGCGILLFGFDQPLVLITISTVLGGAIMVVYTCLLMVTNRRYLPAPIALRGTGSACSSSPCCCWARRRRSSPSTSSGTCFDPRLRRPPAHRPRAVGGPRRARLPHRGRLIARYHQGCTP